MLYLACLIRAREAEDKSDDVSQPEVVNRASRRWPEKRDRSVVVRDRSWHRFSALSEFIPGFSIRRQIALIKAEIYIVIGQEEAQHVPRSAVYLKNVYTGKRLARCKSSRRSSSAEILITFFRRVRAEAILTNKNGLDRFRRASRVARALLSRFPLRVAVLSRRDDFQSYAPERRGSDRFDVPGSYL